MVVYGGKGPGEVLENENLYIFDMSKGEDKSIWMIIPTVGPNPGKRYGHSLNFISPYVVLFGGNNGNRRLNDVWIFSISVTPFSWSKLDFKDDIPSPRDFHSTSECHIQNRSSMIIVFGGRSKDKASENELWGLRRNQKGKWKWIKEKSQTLQNPLLNKRYKVILIID